MGALNPATVIAGLIGGVAQTAIGIGASETKLNANIEYAKAQQEINEKYQAQQLSNFVNTAYGLIYLMDYNDRALRVTVAMPMNVDQSYYDAYHAEYGYTAQGLKTIAVSDGYIQGRLTETPVNGPKGDMLIAELINGVKMKVVS